jgi:hypothetical protein
MIIQIEITDEELACFKHDVLESPEVWLTKAWQGKASKCKGRMIQQELPKVLADPAPKQITDEASLVQTILSRPDYKDRAAREAEAAELERQRAERIAESREEKT